MTRQGLSRNCIIINSFFISEQTQLIDLVESDSPEKRSRVSLLGVLVCHISKAISLNYMIGITASSKSICGMCYKFNSTFN